MRMRDPISLRCGLIGDHSVSMDGEPPGQAGEGEPPSGSEDGEPSG